MKEKFDIVIAGAGPAGLACARQLADSGLSVLLLDRNVEPGPKICAGGVRVSDLKNLGLVPDEIKGCDVFSIADYGEMVDFTTIDRKLLGQTQLKFIENAGNIKKLFGWRINEIFPNEITIKNGAETGNIQFEYLIGADGSASKIRQKLGIKTRNELLANMIQCDLPLNDKLRQFNTLTFFFDKSLFGEWYAYFFPHNGLKIAKVGCGGSIAWIKNEHVDLRKNINICLDRLDIHTQGITFNGALINADYQGFDFTASPLGKVYLCGDAAGFAFYLTGEGIHQAIMSGTEIGKMILDNQYKSQPLSDLIRRKEEEVKNIINCGKQGLWKRITKIFSKLK